MLSFRGLLRVYRFREQDSQGTRERSDRGTYVFAKEVSVGSKLRVSFPDKLHHVLHCP